MSRGIDRETGAGPVKAYRRHVSEILAGDNDAAAGRTIGGGETGNGRRGRTSENREVAGAGRGATGSNDDDRPGRCRQGHRRRNLRSGVDREGGAGAVKGDRGNRHKVRAGNRNGGVNHAAGRRKARDSRSRRRPGKGIDQVGSRRRAPAGAQVVTGDGEDICWAAAFVLLPVVDVVETSSRSLGPCRARKSPGLRKPTDAWPLAAAC